MDNAELIADSVEGRYSTACTAFGPAIRKASSSFSGLGYGIALQLHLAKLLPIMHHPRLIADSVEGHWGRFGR